MIAAFKKLAEIFREKKMEQEADNAIKVAKGFEKLEKEAQYLGVQGYWLQQERAFCNCYRDKRNDKDMQPQEAWMECWQEYKDLQNKDSDEFFEKYASKFEQRKIKASKKDIQEFIDDIEQVKVEHKFVGASIRNHSRHFAKKEIISRIQGLPVLDEMIDNLYAIKNRYNSFLLEEPKIIAGTIAMLKKAAAPEDAIGDLNNSGSVDSFINTLVGFNNSYKSLNVEWGNLRRGIRDLVIEARQGSKEDYHKATEIHKLISRYPYAEKKSEWIKEVAEKAKALKNPTDEIEDSRTNEITLDENLGAYKKYIDSVAADSNGSLLLEKLYNILSFINSAEGSQKEKWQKDYLVRRVQDELSLGSSQTKTMFKNLVSTMKADANNHNAQLILNYIYNKFVNLSSQPKEQVAQPKEELAKPIAEEN